MYSRSLILCAAALLTVSTAFGDDKPASEKPKTGLKPGNDLPGPFRPYNVTGKFEKKFHCLSDEHGLNPNVMVIVQNVSVGEDNFKPVLSLLQQLDQYIVDKPKSRLNAFAVFLFNDLTDVVKEDEMRAKYVDVVTKINGTDKPLKQVVLSLDSVGALKSAGYDINPEWHVAVVLYDKLQVTNVYTAVDPSKLDGAAIMKEVKENLAPFKK